MKCRPATRDDIPEMTRIITEGFLDYPLHIMLKPYLYQSDRYPQCLAAINRMLASSYQWARHALVVEHEGRVVATALMHDRKVGVVRSFVSGGYELFRYASPRLVADFLDVTDRSDQIAIDNGDFDLVSRGALRRLEHAWPRRGALAGLQGLAGFRGEARWTCLRLRDLDGKECAFLSQWRL